MVGPPPLCVECKKISNLNREAPTHKVRARAGGIRRASVRRDGGKGTNRRQKRERERERVRLGKGRRQDEYPNGSSKCPQNKTINENHNARRGKRRRGEGGREGRREGRREQSTGRARARRFPEAHLGFPAQLLYTAGRRVQARRWNQWRWLVATWSGTLPQPRPGAGLR